MSRELNKIDLAVLYCIVHFREGKVYDHIGEGFSAKEAEEMVDRLGITELWGNHKFMRGKDGAVVVWENKPVPDGIVNRFVLKHKIGAPLFHSTQFYRIGDKLAAAGWMVGLVNGVYYFTPRESAKEYVATKLDVQMPSQWPSSIEVEDGQIIKQLIAR